MAYHKSHSRTSALPSAASPKKTGADVSGNRTLPRSLMVPQWVRRWSIGGLSLSGLLVQTATHKTPPLFSALACLVGRQSCDTAGSQCPKPFVSGWSRDLWLRHLPGCQTLFENSTSAKGLGLYLDNSHSLLYNAEDCSGLWIFILFYLLPSKFHFFPWEVTAWKWFRNYWTRNFRELTLNSAILWYYDITSPPIGWSRCNL